LDVLDADEAAGGIEAELRTDVAIVVFAGPPARRRMAATPREFPHRQPSTHTARVHREFGYRFGADTAGLEARYAGVASKILELWQVQSLPRDPSQ
jgi:hypothetical protein